MEEQNISVKKKIFFTIIGVLVPLAGSLISFLLMWGLIAADIKTVFIFGKFLEKPNLWEYSIFVVLILFLVFICLLWRNSLKKSVMVALLFSNLFLGFIIFYNFISRYFTAVDGGSQKVIHCIVDDDNDPLTPCPRLK